MKNVKKVSKVLCAFGVSTVLLAGVVGAASGRFFTYLNFYSFLNLL